VPGKILSPCVSESFYPPFLFPHGAIVSSLLLAGPPPGRPYNGLEEAGAFLAIQGASRRPFLGLSFPKPEPPPPLGRDFFSLEEGWSQMCFLHWVGVNSFSKHLFLKPIPLPSLRSIVRAFIRNSAGPDLDVALFILICGVGADFRFFPP